VQIDLGTRNEQVINAIVNIHAVLNRSLEELPPKNLFSESKLAARNSFIFRFENPRSIARRAAMLKILDYPDDLDEEFFNKIPHITKAEVQESGRRWLEPERLVIVIVGRISAEQIHEELGEEFAVYKLEFDTEPRIVGKIQ
jgi:predicted Zn-dependent peptidase